MILEAQNCPSAGSFVVGDLDRSGPPDCRASMMASAYVMREVMTIPHSNRVCRSSAVSAQCRDLFADKAVLPASSCSTYSQRPPAFLPRELVAPVGPQILAPTACTGPLDYVVRGL